MLELDFSLRTRIVRAPGALSRVGELARQCGMTRVLLVTDAGLVAAGHAGRTELALRQAGVEVIVFAGVLENPTALEVEACREVAALARIDGLVGLGGGSSLDTARGCNFVLTQGGRIHDYQGSGKASRPMLPFLAIPTTAGTGSETQSYALISDPISHCKMACGDSKAAAAVALLDPELTLTQPPRVTALTGLDAAAHALESAVCMRRTPVSDMFAGEAFRLAAEALPRVLSTPLDLEARASMQWAAALAGLAIENSMLGAAHAAANPLTAHYGMAHGQAVATMLPLVIRRNAPAVADLYHRLACLAGLSHRSDPPLSAAEALASWVEQRMVQAGLPLRLGELAIQPALLARDAAQQWTGTFNPIPIDFEELYCAAID